MESVSEKEQQPAVENGLEPLPYMHDRVMEAYYGKLGPQFMRDTQDRIHWICRHAEGKAVLDVGCSQGTVPILLAREGYRVVGVDISVRAIEEAQQYLKEESQNVRDNIHFIIADFLSPGFKTDKVNTVIMSEILEHLVHPQRCVDAAADVLAEGGCLIVTVPFGINDWIDQKQTFYFIEPYRLIARRFTIQKIEFLGKWLGIVARRKVADTDHNDFEFSSQQVEMLESAFYKIERGIRYELAEVDALKNKLIIQQQHAQCEIGTFRARIAVLEECLASCEEISARKLAVLEDRAVSVKQTISFKLGNLLLNSFKTPGDLLKLPKNLLQLKKESKARRLARGGIGKSELNDHDLEILLQHYNAGGIQAVMAFLQTPPPNSYSKAAAFTAISKHFHSVIPVKAAEAARAAYLCDPVPFRAKWLALRLFDAGFITEPSVLLSNLPQSVDLIPAEKKQADTIMALKRIRSSYPSIARRIRCAYKPAPGTLLYVAASTLPYHTSGYTTRTHELLLALKKQGIQVFALTRPGYPWDRSDRKGQPDGESTVVDGIEYLHHRNPSRDLPLDVYFDEAARAIAVTAKELRVSAIHAASDHVNALPALLAARQLGIPFSYEMRGLWELSKASKVPDYEATELFQLGLDLEAFVAGNADLVYVISRALGRYVEQWGILPEKIALLPNCINEKTIDNAWMQSSQHGAGNFTIGYAGSLVGYEGLDLLIMAIAILKAKGVHVEARLIGDGVNRASLEDLCRERNVADQVRFLGKLVPAAACKELAAVHAVAIPRKPHQVCSLIPPIKLTEAMALGLPVLVPNLPVFREEVEDGVTGLLFQAGDSTALANAIQRLITETGLAGQLGEHAWQHVRSNRVWNRFAEEISQTLQHVNAAQEITCAALRLRFDKDLRQLRMACVMDEFTFHSYNEECTLLQLHPEECLQQLASFKPDVLFIESAWKGLDGLWQLKISNNSLEINSCIQWCNENNVPTLFWNKEDPVHFSTFIPLAQQVDYVFTTDIDCIPKYKQAVGHDRVYLLPFAAQPRTHNPVELYERKDAFNFAGSYYLRYPVRQRDFISLIDTAKTLRPVEIYDRNFNNPHPHYTFPDAYKPMILGNLPFEEIDKAYKGYRYGINMNTIKQSQTMFARRMFELLASNTIVVSNFSRGVRMLFGDLVISSDDATQLHRRLQKICTDETRYRKLRLMALRKIMQEHTYAHRLAYIHAKLSGTDYRYKLPEVAVLAIARSAEEQLWVEEHFKRQSYPARTLYLLQSYEHVVPANDANIQAFTDASSCRTALQNALQAIPLFAAFAAGDYYGPAYLMDLALASTYSDSLAFGKAACYRAEGTGCSLSGDGQQYHPARNLEARSALVRSEHIPTDWLDSCMTAVESASLQLTDMLATDEFHYCRSGSTLNAEVLGETVDDLSVPNQGISFATDLAPLAESLSVQASRSMSVNGLPQLSGEMLFELIPKPASKTLQLSYDGGVLRIRSTLPADKHIYLYANKQFTREELNLVVNSRFKLESDYSIPNLRTVFEFQDENGTKLSHAMSGANGEAHALAVPNECRYLRFGLRVQGPGAVNIHRLVLGDHGTLPAAIVGLSSCLIVTKQYPAYDDLYRYGFLHSRVRAYKKAGLMVDIFRITREPEFVCCEFEDIDVASGDAQLLDNTLQTGRYKHVCVHLLDENMWRVLVRHLDNIRVTVWVHGAEIQVWQRREFEFELMTPEEVLRQKKLSDKRKDFWQSIFKEPHPNLHFVFVSKTFAQEVATDLDVNIPKGHVSVIHNYIDGSLFPYQPKSADHRLNLLSIRTFASRKYGNDLTVAAIVELAKRPFFKELKFHILGDGDLFDETVAPLKHFDNVRLERRFLTHPEIANLQENYGIFLNPTRWDSQGVSRDEAMSCGLVAITNNVAAIPEFVDASCGIVVPAEDYKAIADGVEYLYRNPEMFLRLSEAAAQRVRAQCGIEQTINREINIVSAETVQKQSSPREAHANQLPVSSVRSPYPGRLLELQKQTMADEGAKIVASKLWVAPGFKPYALSPSMDWAADPFRNRTWCWHLHQFQFMLPLIAHDRINGGTQGASLAIDLLKSWAEHYLHDRTSSDVWHDHGTAFRARNVLLLRTHLEMSHDTNLLEDMRIFVDDFLEVHAQVLAEENFYSKSTNHGFDQSLILLELAMAFPGKPANAVRVETAVARLNHEIRHAFADDGGHVENSPAYLNYGLKQVLEAEAVGRSYFGDDNRIGLDRQLLDQAMMALAFMVRPDGLLPIIGDTSRFVVRLFKELAELPSYPVLEYSATGGKKGEPPKSKSHFLLKSGYAMIRGNWSDPPSFAQSIHLVFKCGFLSNYHRHDDDLSFVLCGFGEDWLIDGGLYKYDSSDPIRIHLRSANAHNLSVPLGVKVHRRLQTVQEQSCITEANDDGQMVCVSGRSGMFEGFESIRLLTFHRREEIITLQDTIRCISSQARESIQKRKESNQPTFVTRFLFPDDKILRFDEAAKSHYIIGKNRVLRIEYLQDAPKFNVHRGKKDPRPAGWTSWKPGRAEPAKCLELTSFADELDLRVKLSFLSRNEVEP